MASFFVQLFPFRNFPSTNQIQVFFLLSTTFFCCWMNETGELFGAHVRTLSMNEEWFDLSNTFLTNFSLTKILFKLIATLLSTQNPLPAYSCNPCNNCVSFFVNFGPFFSKNPLTVHPFILNGVPGKTKVLLDFKKYFVYLTRWL